MASSSELRALVMRRYGLAVAIAEEVAAIHVALTQSVRDGVNGLAIRSAMDSHAEAAGGAANNWKYNQVNNPGHWWTWYPPEKKGRKVLYAAGLWVYADDVDGHLAVAIQSQMNSKIPGISGALFREKVAKLPPGDARAWVSGGWICQHVSTGAGVATVEELATATVGATVPHFEFLRALYDEILNAVR